MTGERQKSESAASEPSASQPSAAGQHERFTALFLQNQNRIFGYLVSLVANRAIAEDLFQETCMTLWRRWDQYEPARPFLPWAFGIAFNHVRNFARNKQNQGVLLPEPILEKLAKTREEQEGELQRRRQALEGCLGKLPGAERVLLEECYAPGSTVRTVAERRGLPLEGLYKKIQRLRASLHDCVTRASGFDQ